ncbi:hypothetical protein ACU635_58970 [[Actinomadura] parvosata]|uniref:hypothetical protein n=1 Tax=[Actinomadura] parvosata TaxID=1955412 RepID=UPI00406C778C
MPLAADTRRTYASRVRMYLAWLADRPTTGADPLTDSRARDWAVRDYRYYLLREADPKRSVRYVDNALAALDDFHVRRGLGKADVDREDIPKTAPKAMNAPAQIRWLRAMENWPHPRDRYLGLSMPSCRSGRYDLVRHVRHMGWRPRHVAADACPGAPIVAMPLHRLLAHVFGGMVWRAPKS